ncbi:MAG: patatin-like phospholipase family protein [Thermoanaerobaculales bacterium]
MKRLLIGTLAGLLLVAPGGAAEEPPEKPSKLVLVLSGGGARGVAHIGVLRVLEELHIAPDLIVGTSMGSIIGGLYAAGWRPDEIEELIDAIDWGSVFTDRVDRRNLSFRRKQDDRPVMIQGRLHFDGLKPVLPSGVIQGQRLELILRTAEALSAGSSDFDRLPIPFRAVAADIATGEAVVLDSGSLATAMRASMSVPGALPPVRHGELDLVDGGIAANLPIGIAKDLGATKVIAVDISSPLLKEGERIGSFMSVYTHLNSLLTVSNRERDVRLLAPDDLLIVPELGDISFISFDRLQEAAAIGEDAARLKIDELRSFTATEKKWATFAARPRANPTAPIEIDRLRLVNTSRVDDRIVHSELVTDPPETLDRKVLGWDLLELYNTRYFGNISFHIDEEDGGERELVVETPPPPYGRGSLQLGLAFFDDFEGGNGYSIRARHQLLPANRRGGEWDTLFQLGTVSGVVTEFYQPVDWGMNWFVAPSLEYERGTQELWFEGQAFAEYSFSRYDARLAAGRVLGRWGELRLAAFSAENRGSPRIGDPLFPRVSERRGGGELTFRIDTEDSVVFPRSGAQVDAFYTVSSAALGAESKFRRVWFSGSYAWSLGEFTLVPSLEYGENLEPAESFFDLFFLGGFNRLSGLGLNELFGEKVALARLIGYRRLAHLDLAGMKIRFYAGGSFEAGNTYFYEESVDLSSMLLSWSFFVGADTFIGPILLAYGFSEGGRNRVYLSIGHEF